MKKIKRILSALILMFGLLCTGCDYPKFYYDIFAYHEISDTEVAVGDLCSEENGSVYFVPEIYKTYAVTKLGFTGLIDEACGTLTPRNVNQLYFPSTIKSIRNDYLRNCQKDFKVMYCGNVLDLFALNSYSFSNIVYYVPAEDYDSYYEIFTGDKEKYLKKANVVYDLNYDGREYYYVDYILDDNLIVNIPPSPTRTGYKFDGWYTEETFENKWDFSSDLVSLNVDEVELRLYAKWV